MGGGSAGGGSTWSGGVTGEGGGVGVVRFGSAEGVTLSPSLTAYLDMLVLVSLTSLYAAIYSDRTYHMVVML